jgi:hypothetical protein
MHNYTRKRLVGFFWPKFSEKFDVVNRNAQMLDAIRRYDQPSVAKRDHKKEMYRAVNERLGGGPITFLEFGVLKGETLRTWTSINTHAASRFFGFDSFEGLPETWNHGFWVHEKGCFDVGGVMPVIEDPRVKLIKGWFQQTLPTFLKETDLGHPIVLHIDSDLHSSALYVLCNLDSKLKSGDIVMFDEYTSPSNEYLAWEEYKHAFMRTAECIAMGNSWTQISFVIT